MVDRPQVESVDPFDLWDFEGLDRGATPTCEEPYNEEDGMAHVKKELEEQEEEMRRKWEETVSEAAKSYRRGQVEDLRQSLGTPQTRSLVPYKPSHLPSQGGSASRRSGVKKVYQQPPSRQPRNPQTAKSTRGDGRGAIYNAGEGSSISRDGFVGDKERKTTFKGSDHQSGSERYDEQKIGRASCRERV